MDARALFLQARNLLRSLTDAGALAGNGLTKRAVLNMRSLGLSDDAVIAEITGTVERAISRLSSRERRIVEGREVYGRSHESLYAALGLSRRQYFRIRRAALVKIAHCVSESPHRNHSVVSSVPASRAMRMTEAAAQYQLGLTRAALNSLRLALRESSDAVDRSDAALTIAHHYANEGSYAQTRRYLTEARSSLANVRDEQPIRALLIDLLALEGAWYYNDATLDVRLEIDRVENQTLALARFALDRNDAASVVESLARLAEIRFEQGDVPRAGSLMSACMAEVARQPEISGSPFYRALSSAAMVSMALPDGLPNAADYYAHAYRIALDHNALRDGVIAAARLCSILRVAGLSQRAVAVASTILARARRVCAGPVYAGIALDFAAAMIDAGCDEGVAPLLAEAATHTRTDTFDSSLAGFLKAQYLQRQNRLRDALSLVQDALLAFRRAKRRVHESAALRIQAELQLRLGRRHEAAESAGDALAILERNGSPHSLERAYRVSAAITGNSEHDRFANELRAERERVARGLAGIVGVALT